MRRFLFLAAPLLVGSAVAQLRDLVNYRAVLFPLSRAGTDLVSASELGRTVPMGLDNLVPYSVSIAMFPYFCDMVDKDDLGALGEAITRSARVLVLFFAALAGALAAVALPVTAVIFANLDSGTLRLAALASACYLCVLPALAVEKPFMVAFFSNRRTVTPTLLGVVFSFASIGVSVVCIRTIRLTGADALLGVAAGYVAARYMKVVALAVFLRRKVPIFPAPQTAAFLARALAVALVCAGSAYLVRLAYEARWPLDAAIAGGARLRLLRAAPEVALAGAASIAAGLAAIRLLRMDELDWVMDWWRRRRRRGAGLGDGRT
jgi:peptidoglycan biosynthesis protein MviN/MurJ (putative lipid II flippase)